MATQYVGYAAVRLCAGGQLTNAVATSAADDGAIQALSFSKPIRKRHLRNEARRRAKNTQDTLQKAASPLGQTRGPTS